MKVYVRQPGRTEGVVKGVDAAGRWIADPVDEDLVGADWWALPGLVDAHVHLSADELSVVPGEPEEILARAYGCLDSGTFLVIDKGWCDDTAVMTLRAAPPHSVPDFEAAGRMIAVPEGYYVGFAVETDSDGLAEAVRSATNEGSGWVKLVGDWPRRGRGAVANFTPDDLRGAVEIAHAGGARVAIHTMAPDVPSAAVAAGVDSIEHGLFLTAEDLGTLAARAGAWVPTVRRMEAIVEMLGPESSGGRLVQDGLDNVRSLMGRIPEGVNVLTGSDLAVPAGAIGSEVSRLVEYGLDPVRAVDAASETGRAYLGRPEGFTPGHAANAVFFDRDPYLDPAALADPVAVLWNGTLR